MIDPFIAGILITVSVIGLAVGIRKYLEAREARRQEIIDLQYQVRHLNTEFEFLKREVRGVERETERAKNDVALLSNHLGLTFEDRPNNRAVAIKGGPEKSE